VTLCNGVIGSRIMRLVDGWLKGLEVQSGASWWASQRGSTKQQWP